MTRELPLLLGESFPEYFIDLPCHALGSSESFAAYCAKWSVLVPPRELLLAS